VDDLKGHSRSSQFPVFYRHYFLLVMFSNNGDAELAGLENAGVEISEKKCI